MQNVLPYLLQASGCMAVLLLLYWLLLKRETFFSFNRWYLVGGLVLATVLPHIGLPATQAPLYVTPALMATVELPALTAITASTESTTGWTDRLMALYGVGVFLLAVRLVYRVHRLRKLTRHLPGEALGGYTLFRTAGQVPTSSFLTWLFWDDSQNLSEAEKRQILRHEEVHIRQWHSLDVLLAEAVTVFFWFNPFIYPLKRELRAVHEYLADRGAVQGDSVNDYAQLLTAQILQKYKLTLAQPFNQFQIINRIIMLRIAQNTRPALWKTALSVSLVTLLSVVYACRSSEILEPKGLGTVAGKDGISVSGIVSAQEDGTKKPLPGAAVIVKGTNTGTVTDQTGYFHLATLPAGSKLVFSHVGFKTEELQLDPDGKAVSGSVTHVVQLDRDITVISLENVKPANSAAKFAPPSGSSAPEGTVFMVVEKMPEYKGGIEALVSYFGQNLSYPQEAREKKLTGTVFVSFIVNPDGSIGNPTVLKGIGSGCDEEALRVIRSMPAWNPGMQNGQPVAVKYSMPIKFSPQ